MEDEPATKNSDDEDDDDEEVDPEGGNSHVTFVSPDRQIPRR